MINPVGIADEQIVNVNMSLSEWDMFMILCYISGRSPEIWAEAVASHMSLQGTIAQFKARKDAENAA